jgi:hypothetical protein
MCGALQARFVTRTGIKGPTPTSAWPRPRGKALVPVHNTTVTKDMASVPIG